MNTALIDHFRCPEHLAILALQGELSSMPGYFCFGQNTICYGRTTAGQPTRRANGSMIDVLAETDLPPGVVKVQFNPDEVVLNLRRERYLPARQSLPGKIVRGAYYALRPLMPVALRKHLQRLRLADWDKIPFPAWPVDFTVEQLLEKLLKLVIKSQHSQPIPFIWFWPHGARACMIMTHDVESTAGRNFCSRLMDIDESHGIKSSFQVVPEGRYGVSREFLTEISRRGFEINVHDLNHDGHLFDDHETFRARAKKINDYAKQFGAVGFRSAVMYRNADWLGELDFAYDMSTPNVAHLDPQRGGCCTVFPFFIDHLVELPLTTTQDYPLFHILGDYSIELWKRQTEAIVQHHGLASFIVHPDYLLNNRSLRTYTALLKYLAAKSAEQNLWLARPGEVAAWWEKRQHMRLVADHGRWQVEGPGSEQARVAYATLEDGRLTYQVVNQNRDVYAKTGTIGCA